MDVDQEESRRRMEALTEGLRRSGAKLTRQRLEIVREVAGSSDHPDVETVFQRVRQRVPNVSLDTVYRTLWLLTDLRLIATLAPTLDRVRFDANPRRHHHFVCVNCGVAHDFYSDEFDQLQIPDSVKTLGSVERTQVEVRGTCAECAKESHREHRGR